jgi:serine/threonine protein kinase
MDNNLIGKSLGRYRILEPLGEGGMATVYKAYDSQLRRDVAIKLISPGLQDLDKFNKRFHREAQALAKLVHPNIVRLFDYGEEEGIPFLVMDFIQGKTLKEFIGEPIHWMDAAKLLAPIASALAYSHQHHVIHRDVKPSNILVDQNNKPSLTDFGIAKVLEDEETLDLTSSGVIGTPQYMSPEQGMGHPVDERTDVYSLGIVLYEMLTGKKPFTEQTPFAVMIEQTRKPLTSPRKYVPNLPKWVETVLLAALAVKPEDRYPDMSSFALVLEEMANGKKVELSPQLKKKTSSKNRRNSKAGIYVVSLMLIAAGLIGMTWFLIPKSTSGDIQETPTNTPMVQQPASTQILSKTPTPVREATLVPTSIPTQNVISSDNIAKIELTMELNQLLGPIKDADFSGSVPRLVVIDTSDKVSIWDMDAQRKIQSLVSTLATTFNPVEEVLFSRDGDYVSGLVEFQGVTVWKAKDGFTVADITSPARNMALSPTVPSIAIGYSGNPQANLFNYLQNSSEVTFELSSAASNLSISTDGKSLWVISGAGVEIFRVLDGARVGTISNIKSGSNTLITFSPDNKTAYVAGSLWNTSDFSPAYELKDSPPEPSSVVFSPDSSLIAASAGKDILFWQTGTGVLLQTIKTASTSNLIKISFSPNGDELWAVTEDGTILRWGVK